MTEYTVQQVDWSGHHEILLAIRFAVFVREQGVPPALEHDDYDPTALHLLATDRDGKPMATARMLTDGHIGRMAVVSIWRGRGVGSRLLEELLHIASERGYRRVFLNAQCNAESFYRRHGFQSVGGIFVDAGIDHRRMEKELTA